ncbi:hypothetical protein Halar_0191 (plasmid) [halophilic archaeon DL31]|jgi:hypothetical protein|nr:hypothetical protein Halar_0191 [halophilic archaeon DL31]
MRSLGDDDSETQVGHTDHGGSSPNLSAINGDYPTAREVYADLRSEPYITYRGNRGIELNKSNFDKLADVLYYDCGWEAWEIDSRLKHYEGIGDHDWA